MKVGYQFALFRPFLPEKGFKYKSADSGWLAESTDLS